MLVVILVLAGRWLYPREIEPRLHRWEASRLLVRFQANPDQPTAKRLVELLESQHLPQGQGDAVLRALLTPQVIQRSAYAAGRPA
jgi:hypothetical protein